MKNRSLILIILSFVFVYGCKKKDEETKEYEVSGHLFSDCHMIPAGSSGLALYTGDPGIFSNPSQEFYKSLKTFSDGSFSFKHPALQTKFLYIGYTTSVGYVTIADSIDAASDIKNLSLFLDLKTNIQVSLNVNNSYTSNDTLFINLSQGYIAFPGPFNSGILYSAPNIKLGKQNEYLMLQYSINHSSTKYQLFKADKYCSDTLKVSFDIH